MNFHQKNWFICNVLQKLLSSLAVEKSEKSLMLPGTQKYTILTFPSYEKCENISEKFGMSFRTIYHFLNSNSRFQIELVITKQIIFSARFFCTFVSKNSHFHSCLITNTNRPWFFFLPFSFESVTCLKYFFPVFTHRIVRLLWFTFFSLGLIWTTYTIKHKHKHKQTF
jgi:hypothetical protein